MARVVPKGDVLPGDVPLKALVIYSRSNGEGAGTGARPPGET